MLLSPLEFKCGLHSDSRNYLVNIQRRIAFTYDSVQLSCCSVFIHHALVHTHLVHTHTHTHTHKAVHSQIRVMVCLYMVTVLKEGQVAVTAI